MDRRKPGDHEQIVSVEKGRHANLLVDNQFSQ